MTSTTSQRDLASASQVSYHIVDSFSYATLQESIVSDSYRVVFTTHPNVNSFLPIRRVNSSCSGVIDYSLVAKIIVTNPIRIIHIVSIPNGEPFI